jgi:hypothetical protein
VFILPLTMSSTRIPSVNDTYFQHKVLTRIHGIPVYETLQLLTTELKANAASVPTTIGGGHYGHLGLVVSDQKYATLANTIPWITPVNPGPFVPPAGATRPQLEAAQDVWRDEKLAFEICQATEKALIAQVVESIDSIYLRALLNRTTGQYASNLRDVLTHLFTTHGKITPQQIRTKENAIYNMAFDISQPVDTVFNAIDDLADLAEHANSTMSPQQMMDLAYVIFAKHPILQQDLRTWNRMTVVQRTWANMITHFREAQEDLSSLPTAGDIFHQANSMTTMADLVAQRLLEAMPPPPPEAVPPPDTVNTIITQREISLAAREAALLTQMQEMMTVLRTGTVNTHTQQRRNNRGRGGGGGRNNNTAHTTSNGGRRTPGPRQYCWSHGACAHSSSECNSPHDGHQTTATFQTMQGGSTNNLQWVPTGTST